MGPRVALLGLILAAGLCAGSAQAAKHFPGPPTSAIVTPPGAAVAANGPSDDAALSQDNRDVRLLAFDSAASNLVVGDLNGRRDVFVFRKTSGASELGGSLSLASVSTSRAQANGDSSNPSVDGTTRWAPRCVAFQSTATNLAPRDHAADSDVFVRDLHRHTTTLVSVGQRDAVDASMDGRCRYIAYEASGWVLVRDLAARRTVRVARGRKPDLQRDGHGVVYQRGGQIRYRQLGTSSHRLKGIGGEFLVSDTRYAAPGNGVSSNPVVDDHGTYVAFQSTATDLCASRCVFPQGSLYRDGWVDPSKVPDGDANGPMSDIYRRSLHARPGDPLAMTLVSYDWNHQQANAPSYNPAITRAGQEIVFDSAANNMGGVGAYYPDTRGFANVFSWYASANRAKPGGLVELQTSWPPPGGGPTVFNGSSTNPSISSRGNYIAFTSTEYGVGGDINGGLIPDVFLRWAGRSTEGLPTG